MLLLAILLILLNIFPTEYRKDGSGLPSCKRSARSSADQHLHKIINESCQMLTTAYRIVHGEPLKTVKTSKTVRGVPSYPIQSWEIDMMTYVHGRWPEMGRDIDTSKYPRPVRKTHVNHPMSVWIRTSRTNFFWVCQYAMELCKEHERRPLSTGKFSTPHMYRPHIEWFIQNLPKSTLFPAKGLTPMPLCMADECKSVDGDPVLSYRAWVSKKYSTVRVIKGSTKQSRVIDWIRSPHRKPIWLQDICQK